MYFVVGTTLLLGFLCYFLKIIELHLKVIYFEVIVIDGGIRSKYSPQNTQISISCLKTIHMQW